MNTGSYIDGKWFHPKSERLVRNINPADLDDVIAEFPAATSQDAHRAIEAAQAAFKAWRERLDPSVAASYGARPISRASALTKSPAHSPAKRAKF